MMNAASRCMAIFLIGEYFMLGSTQAASPITLEEQVRQHPLIVVGEVLEIFPEQAGYGNPTQVKIKIQEMVKLDEALLLEGRVPTTLDVAVVDGSASGAFYQAGHKPGSKGIWLLNGFGGDFTAKAATFYLPLKKRDQVMKAIEKQLQAESDG